MEYLIMNLIIKSKERRREGGEVGVLKEGEGVEDGAKGEKERKESA